MYSIKVFGAAQTEDFYNSIFSNLDHFRNENSAKWYLKYMTDRGYSGTQFPDLNLDSNITLKYDKRSNNDSDAINAITLHKALKNVEDQSLLGNPSVLNFIAMDNLPYLRKRWPLPPEDSKALRVIQTRYVCPPNPTKTNYGRNWISSLYRVASLSYYPGHPADDYALTHEAFANQDMARNMVEKDAFKNPIISKEVLQFSIEMRQANRPLNMREYQLLGNRIAIIDGSVCIDSLDMNSKDSDGKLPGKIYKMCQDYIEYLRSDKGKAYLKLNSKNKNDF